MFGILTINLKLMKKIKKMSDFEKVMKILEIAKKFKHKDNFSKEISTFFSKEKISSYNETFWICFYPKNLLQFTARFHFYNDQIIVSVENQNCENRFVRESFIKITDKKEINFILDFFNKNYNRNYFDDLIEEFEEFKKLNNINN